MTADEVRRIAPKCTGIASQLRAVFEDVKIERLQEGVALGKPDDHDYATCFYLGDGTRIVKKP